MKTFALLLISLACTMSHASDQNWQKLPDAVVDASTLGGSVLLLKMKYSLVISGTDEEQISRELGAQTKADFYRDMILDTDSAQLLKTYGSNAKNEVTLKTIQRYQALLSSNGETKLN